MSRSPLHRVRELCLALPHATERLSHGEPTWFVRERPSFVMFADRHHDDRVAFWCAGRTGAQDAYVTSDPQRYFVPPYVGHRGWLGVWLDVEVEWNEVAGLIEDAYRVVAPKRFIDELDARPADDPSA
jgi:hypothetical protein